MVERLEMIDGAEIEVPHTKDTQRLQVAGKNGTVVAVVGGEALVSVPGLFGHTEVVVPVSAITQILRYGHELAADGNGKRRNSFSDILHNLFRGEG